MADDLADRISDGHVAVLELVPGEQRFIDLSRFVLRGGASRFAGVVLDDEPIRYVLPVGVPSRTTLDYGVLLIQRSRCALVWRTDPMKPSHALIAELGPDTTVQAAPVVVRGEMWGRFDLRHTGSTPMTFLVPPVDSPALPDMLHRVLVVEPHSHQGHVDAEPLAVEITEGIPMIPPADAGASSASGAPGAAAAAAGAPGVAAPWPGAAAAPSSGPAPVTSQPGAAPVPSVPAPVTAHPGATSGSSSPRPAPGTPWPDAGAASSAAVGAAASTQGSDAERTQVLEPVPDVERTVPMPAFRAPGATAAPRPGQPGALGATATPSPAPVPRGFPAAAPGAAPTPATAAPAPSGAPFAAPGSEPTPAPAPATEGSPASAAAPAAGGAPAAAPGSASVPGGAPAASADQDLFRSSERRAPHFRPPVAAPPRPVTPASASPAAPQEAAPVDAANPWQPKRRRRTPAPGFAPGTSGPSVGVQRPPVVAVPPTTPAPNAQPVAAQVPATRDQAGVPRQGLPEWASGFLTGLIVTLVLGGILVFAKWMGWLG